MHGHPALTCAALIGLACAVPAVGDAATGGTFYVSKLGDNSDGSSWVHAFRTVQAALSAIPDGMGGYRVIVRPDTYMEANLFTSNQGAEGAYNELVGDQDGRYGSGRTGQIIIDSSDPDQQGFKSYDWWGSIRAFSQGWSPEHTDATFSAICWDRWILRDLYFTGGDGGLMFDCTDRVEPFTVIVEDCVSIGRAFGGGVASCLSRTDEPIVFRRCHLWALDFWGDTSGAYVRVENESPPGRPDVVFEDCVMVGPQCALKASNFGFHTYSHIKLKGCKLIALNFSQPQGTPTDGIIQSVQEGKLLHVDLEDTTLMGYKVFGVIVDKDTGSEISYSTAGDVKAYVQYQQAMPEGIFRLPNWPVDVFADLVPPRPARNTVLQNETPVGKDLCELSPFIWKGRLAHMRCVRPGSGGQRDDYYLVLEDAETGEELGRLATGYGLASIIVHQGAAFVFASRWDEGGWHDVTVFWSKDLHTWDSALAVAGEDEMVFNTSVCQGPDGFVMAYESNDPAYPAFTTKFATSDDLRNWRKQPEATFGVDRYTACPCLRYADGYYYVLYLERRAPRHAFETYITRSTDLRDWEISSASPVLFANGIDEGINASDPEIIEVDGTTYVYYAVGDQLTWMNVKRAEYPAPLGEFLASFFDAPSIPDWGCQARQR